MKWIDPIVQEVREAREELARQANYDMHTFFQNLRKDEEKRKSKVTSTARIKNEADSKAY